jgi:tetraacyldisaccharide 4'-kinase
MQKKLLEELWYEKHPLLWGLLPFMLIYRLIAHIRRAIICCFYKEEFNVPIVVVGNLTVGGVGKTPLVIALAKRFSKQGLRVGIVSRGYRAHCHHFPHEVKLDESPWEVGDEPLLLAKKSGCPVVISKKRVEAVRYLLDKYQSQVIISDDGLQHYRMGRAIEIVVVDGQRGFGNGLCLPAGPMREGLDRLRQVDFVVVNGQGVDLMPVFLKYIDKDVLYSMEFKSGLLKNLITGQDISLIKIKTPVAAVAAIGNPERFFRMLTALGLAFVPYRFKDHHAFKREELAFKESVVVMTEKDAVKCQAFGLDNLYYLPVEALLEESFLDALWIKLKGEI